MGDYLVYFVCKYTTARFAYDAKSIVVDNIIGSTGMYSRVLIYESDVPYYNLIRIDSLKGSLSVLGD